MAPVSPVDGIGWHVDCRDTIEAFIAAMSEYDKFGSAAATTITAIVPLLVAIWSLPTADILELYLLDEHIMAVITAGITLGLPVRQTRTLKCLTEEYLRSHSPLHISVPKPGTRSHGYPRRAAFVTAQILVLLIGIVCVHFVADTPPRPSGAAQLDR